MENHPIFEKAGIRARLYLLFIFICLTALSGRLWVVQIIEGDKFRAKADDNRIRTSYVVAPRGLIKDVEGRIVASNRPSFNLEILSEDVKDIDKTLADIAEMTGTEVEILEKNIQSSKSRLKFEPKILLQDISRDMVARIAPNLYRLPGVFINSEQTRNYLYNHIASHLIGYTREIRDKQLEDEEYATYRIGDIIGQDGIERSFERYLQGTRGFKKIIVNARGARVGELSYESEMRGSTIILSIDLDLQAVLDYVLEKQNGAIAVMNAKTGEVLALTSSPTFNPNIFTTTLKPESWRNLQQDAKLTNRAIGGIYPPGSVFKIFTAIAALSENVTNAKESVNCPGYYPFAGRRYGCWRKTGHGNVSLHRSLVSSCDVYYYVNGSRLGVDRIYKYANMFGFSERTGIDIPGEKAGLVPSSAWRRQNPLPGGDTRWYPGETLSVSIGQGAVQVTALQVARAMAAVVNGGKLLNPILIKQVYSADNNLIIDNIGPIINKELDIKPEILEVVKKALAGVVNEPGGTAGSVRLSPHFGVLVGGKTGTAQVAGLQHGIKGKLNDHAWFAGYAPLEDPEIVVAAVAENGGHGGAVAGPIVNKVMTAYFAKKKFRTISIDSSAAPESPRD